MVDFILFTVLGAIGVLGTIAYGFYRWFVLYKVRKAAHAKEFWILTTLLIFTLISMFLPFLGASKADSLIEKAEQQRLLKEQGAVE